MNANDEQAFLETKEKYMKINKGSEYLGSSWFYEKLVNPIEKRNNKDAAYFTKEEIVDLLKSFHYSTPDTIYYKVIILKKYCDWFLTETGNKGTEKENHYNEITYDDCRNYLYSSDNKFIYPERLCSLANSYENPVDKMAVLMLYEGFTSDEIVSIKLPDVHLLDGYIDVKGKQKKISKLVYDAIVDTLNADCYVQVKFIPRVGTDEIRLPLEDGDTLYKTRKGYEKHGDDEIQKDFLIKRRCASLNEKYFKPLNILNSGFVANILKMAIQENLIDDLQHSFPIISRLNGIQELGAQYNKEGLNTPKLSRIVNIYRDDPIHLTTTKRRTNNMNNTRRKSLRKSIYYLDLAREIIDTCNDEESDYRDNMPENLQDSDKYNAADEACDAMDEAISSIDDITSAIHDIL